MIREYLRYRKSVLFLILSILVFFPLVQFLSNLPMDSMFYSMTIFTFLLLLWLLADGGRFYKRHRKLTEIRANISASNHPFPASGDDLEEKYQEIIEELYRMLEDSRHNLEIDHADRIEYYTMWVHQIKTPIAAIRLALQSGDGNPLIEQELFKIEQYAEMALHFVKLSNLEADLIIGEYMLKEIVKDSVKKYAPLFIGKNLSVNIEGLGRHVVTDSKWLAFIIEQLLSNAIKYTDKGGVRFFWEDGLIIEDSGIGIVAGDIERIFEKGYTGCNGRLDKRASGIGLYMAKKVADALSIRLLISSKVGKGTRARLGFPQPLEMMM